MKTRLHSYQEERDLLKFIDEMGVKSIEVFAKNGYTSANYSFSFVDYPGESCEFMTGEIRLVYVGIADNPKIALCPLVVWTIVGNTVVNQVCLLTEFERIVPLASQFLVAVDSLNELITANQQAILAMNGRTFLNAFMQGDNEVYWFAVKPDLSIDLHQSVGEDRIKDLIRFSTAKQCATSEFWTEICLLPSHRLYKEVPR